jgi:two-component system chemotaxis response regulator CheY
MPEPASIKVLVVDDQMTIRSLVRTGLMQLGFTNIAEAPDGEAGLRAMLLPGAPNLVISDFNMPKLDGLSLLRAIRSHDPIRNSFFIMLTGRADMDLVKRAAQFGANNYLVKPFTVAQLKDKIERVVGRLT